MATEADGITGGVGADSSASVDSSTAATGYTPLPVASIAATMADPVPGAVAYSPDGSLAAVVTTGQPLCLAGTQDPTNRRCLTHELAATEYAFSPDGRTVAVLGQWRYGRSGLWLISVDDLSIRSVPDAAGMPSAEVTPSPSGPGSESQATSGDYYELMAWSGNGDLVAVRVRGDQPWLVRVDPASGRASTVVRIASAGDKATGMAAGMRTAVVGVANASGDFRLVVADLADGSLRTVRPLGGALPDGDAGIVPVTVAPAGGQAVLWDERASDYYRPSPPVTVDLTSGATAVLTGTERSSLLAAAYSPDGSELVVLAGGESGSDGTLLVAPADGSRPARAIGNVTASSGRLLGLRWDRGDVVAPWLTQFAQGAEFAVAPWRLTA